MWTKDVSKNASCSLHQGTVFSEDCVDYIMLPVVHYVDICIKDVSERDSIKRKCLEII